MFASRSEADCDRSHIRMFEIGLSSEQYGDYEQGTRAVAQTCEGERLIGISRTEGTFVPKEKWGLFGVNSLYFISPYHRLFKDVNAI